MIREIVYVDMDDVLCDYSRSYSKAVAENPQVKHPQSQLNFFRNLQPKTDAIEAVNKLNSVFDVYFLTAPSVRNPLCYTEKRLWIEDHFGLEMTRKLIISPNKGLNKGKYLIDDHIDGAGQENFEGKVLQFGSDKFPDWKSVLAYLL